MATLGTIRANVRRHLGETTANFYSNADLNQFIGDAFKKFTIIMIEEGEGYFETTVGQGFTANQESYDLSSLSPVFFKVSQVFKRNSYGIVPLQQDEKRFTINSTIYTGTGDSYLPSWKLRGTNIVFQPTPQTTEATTSTTGWQLDYYYLPTFPDASSVDGFTFDANFSTMYEPLVELEATITALEAKEGMGGVSDVGTFKMQRDQFLKVFIDSLERSEGPDRVQYIGTDYSSGYHNRWS